MDFTTKPLTLLVLFSDGVSGTQRSISAPLFTLGLAPWVVAAYILALWLECASRLQPCCESAR